MSKEIRLNAFEMNCIGHLAPDLWLHPRDQSHRYGDLGYWVELAQTLERGKFDGIFLADVLGVYDVFGGNRNAALRHCTQVPVNDPVLLIPPMAHATSNLGFGVTSNVSYEPPYTFARRMSTLDHLTGGRLGWNIVTGYLDSAAKASGLTAQNGHDLRYEIAEEYVQLVYKLWEGSWEDGAVVRDRANRVYAHPEKVHRIRHEGKYYQLDGIHLSEPSPQRTPVLYQAGSSARGREFAARHAECVFIGGPSKEFIAPRVADLRQRAAAYGRDPNDILVFLLMTVITGPTEAAAKAKWDDYRSYVSSEGALTLISGWTGIDLSNYRLDEPIEHVNGEAIVSYVDAAAYAVGGRVRTVGELAAIGGSSPILVGSPVQIADELESWVDEADVDGFNLAYAVTPETFNDFVDLIVPELQRRGRYKREYRPGTLREKFFGPGRARLAYPHPASEHRSSGEPTVDYVSPSTPR